MRRHRRRGLCGAPGMVDRVAVWLLLVVSIVHSVRAVRRPDRHNHRKFSDCSTAEPGG